MSGGRPIAPWCIPWRGVGEDPWSSTLYFKAFWEVGVDREEAKRAQEQNTALLHTRLDVGNAAVLVAGPPCALARVRCGHLIVRHVPEISLG